MPHRSRFGLIAAGALLLIGLQSAAPPQAPPGYLSSFRWQIDDSRFGGFSAIDLSGDGARFTAVSDRGSWVSGQILRDASGRITGLQAGPVLPLQDAGGKALRGKAGDAEGLAIGADGTAWVSFEGDTRVMRYDRLDGPAVELPRAEAFGRMHPNGGPEALAIDALGRLYTLPEGYEGMGWPVPIFRYDAGEWTLAFRFPRDPAFLPAGADFGPDGRLYVLERKFLGPGGFASRVIALDLPAGDAPPGEDPPMLQPQTVLETPPGLHDNLEGLAVWRDAAGQIRLTLIADDNFTFYLRTEIVEYRLPPDPP